jgi:hypothetical protein
VRRGLTLTAALSAAELSQSAASAAVAAGLAGSVVSAALAFAARRMPPAAADSAPAAALAADFLRSMALAKLKIAAALLLATCLLAGGLLAYRQANDPRGADLVAPVSSASSAHPPMLADPADLDEEKNEVGEESYDRIRVRGRVLDPQGRPLAGARLYVGYAPWRNQPDAVAHQPVYPLRAMSGTDGRFHFSFDRSDLDAIHLDASRPVVIAMADGFGLDWAEIGGAAAVTLNLRLVDDFPLEGRVLDAQRRPVAGAKVFVRVVGSDSAANPTPAINPADRRSEPVKKTCYGPLPGQPAQVMTGADGCFRLTGLGRDRNVWLDLERPAMPPTWGYATIRPSGAVPADSRSPRGAPIDFEGVVPLTIRGVVRDKATGQAVAGVNLTVQHTSITTHTDKDGRYELLVNPGSQEHVILAQPQNGQPYFAAAAHMPKTDFELIRGISLRGRVIDQATGKPPKRAVVDYYPLFPNAHCSVLTNLEPHQAASSATLGADGCFSLTVFPGPGVVLVAASPRDSYACARIDPQELAHLFQDKGSQRRREDPPRRRAEKKMVNIFPTFSLDGEGRDGSSWLYVGNPCPPWGTRSVDGYNALGFIQPDEKAKSLTLAVMVQPARPLAGRVIGPDGRPLAGVRVCGLSSIPDPDVQTLKTASFVVEGLNPQRTRELSFYHKERNLGKCLTIRGDQTKPLRVQLEPCGEVIGRVVDRAGKPVAGVHLWFGRRDNGLGVRTQTDHQGCFRAVLVPGLLFQMGATSKFPLQSPPGFMTVESGKTKDLGDLLLNDENHLH